MCLPQRSVKFREFPSGSLRIFILMKSGLAGGWRNATNSWQFMEIKHHDSLNSAVIYPLPPPTSELCFPTFPFKTGARRHLISSICLISPTMWTLDIYSLVWGAAAMSLCILEMLRSSPHTAGMSLAVASCTVCYGRDRYSRHKPRSGGWATCGLLPQITPPEGTGTVFCPALGSTLCPSLGGQKVSCLLLALSSCYFFSVTISYKCEHNDNLSLVAFLTPSHGSVQVQVFPVRLRLAVRHQRAFENIRIKWSCPQFFFLALLTQVMVWI